MKTSRGAVAYGKEKIEYSLRHVDRKTLEIAVHPDLSVVVKAPLEAESDEVRRRVAKRARWIVGQQNYFRRFVPRTPERFYVGGETHLYLGKRYRLKIASGACDEVKLTGGCFRFRVKGGASPDKVKGLLDGWYRRKAEEQFRERFEAAWAEFGKRSLPRPGMRIKRMKKRWGSLSGRGTITLNADLIRAPGECIEYVIVHELCHLRCKDHSPKFYKLLGKMMPDWARRKQKLETALA